MPVGGGGLRSVGADVSVSSLSRAFSLFLSAVPGDVGQKGSSTSTGSRAFMESLLGASPVQ